MQSDDIVLIEGTGHGVQQETPDKVIAVLLHFLDKVEGIRLISLVELLSNFPCPVSYYT